MKIKTADLIDAALDWAVAKCENDLWEQYDDALEAEAEIMPARPSEYLRVYHYGPEFSPSTDWSQGGPIIERMVESHGLVFACRGKTVVCSLPFSIEHQEWFGATPLIAAMRCFVTKALGAEVDVPEELLP